MNALPVSNFRSPAANTPASTLTCRSHATTATSSQGRSSIPATRSISRRCRWTHCSYPQWPVDETAGGRRLPPGGRAACRGSHPSTRHKCWPAGTTCCAVPRMPRTRHLPSTPGGICCECAPLEARHHRHRTRTDHRLGGPSKSSIRVTTTLRANYSVLFVLFLVHGCQWSCRGGGFSVLLVRPLCLCVASRAGVSGRRKARRIRSCRRRGRAAIDSRDPPWSRRGHR